MKNKFPVLLLIFSLCSLAAFQGSEFWHKKEYRQWSEREVKKLLEDSPWARGYTLSQVHITPLQQDNTDVTGRERVDNPRFTYQVQFRSAQPLRQAMVRQMQLTQKYDQMAEDKKQAFDEEAGKFLAARFPDSVVVNISFTTNVQQDDRDVARHWQTQTTDTLKNSTFLISPKGEKVALQRYTVASAGRSFQFVFPRQLEGRPLVGPQDKSIKLEFIHPRVRTASEVRVFIEFKADKMLMQGEVAY